MGLAFITINFCWIFVNIMLWYEYHFSTAEFYFKYPVWVLIVNVILSMAGEVISIKVFRNEIRLLNGTLLNVAAWILCAILNQIAVW